MNVEFVNIDEKLFELISMPQVSLHNRRHKETSEKKITIQQEDLNTPLGNIFGELFAKLKEEIEN